MAFVGTLKQWKILGKTAYNVRMPNHNSNLDDIWKIIWKLQVPQKIRTFIWMLFYGRILTNLERMRRIMSDPVGFVLSISLSPMFYKRIAISKIEIKIDGDLMDLCEVPNRIRKLFGLRQTYGARTCQTCGVRTRSRADVGHKVVF